MTCSGGPGLTGDARCGAVQGYVWEKTGSEHNYYVASTDGTHPRNGGGGT